MKSMALFSNKPAQAEYDRLTALRGASGRWGNVRQGITSTRLDDAHVNSLTRRQNKKTARRRSLSSEREM
jgi:hypothetical protein